MQKLRRKSLKLLSNRKELKLINTSNILFAHFCSCTQYNGNVERCNGTTRDEFYSQYRDIFNVHNVRKQLGFFNKKYNTYRPHQSLGNLTPMEYFKKHYQEVRGVA